MIVSLSSTILSDYLERYTVASALEKHLEAMLDEKALEFRLDMSRYVHAHTQAVKIFTSRMNLIDYINNQDWSAPKGDVEVKYYKKLPSWFPSRAVLRTFANPRYAFILDTEGRVREVYNSWINDPPESLLFPTKRLLQLSYNVSYLTSLDDIPSLVTSDKIINSDGKQIGAMVLSSPVDEEFIISALGYKTKKFIVSLVSDKPEVIIASTDTEVIKKGTYMNDYRDDFIILKQEFFEYGSSDMQFKFVSFLPKSDMNEIISPVIRKDRIQHILQSVLFITLFSLLLFYIIRRIVLMTGRIEQFSRDALGGKTTTISGGDELFNLEKRFQLLTVEVISTNKELKEKADELIKSQSQLVQSEKLSAMGEMAGGLAHELNSPLAGLLPMIEKYRDAEQEGTQAYKELTLMLTACKYMAQIVRDFGAFSRESKGEFDALNLNDVIEETLSFSAGRFKYKSIKLIKEYADDLPDIKGAKTELQQVIINILGNAFDAISNEGEITIKTFSAENKKRVIMEFIDNGVGIEQKKLDKIFDPFYTTKRPGKGTGLGLSLSYAIIDRHKGKMLVRSEVGKGTRFSISLPSSSL